jgi:hypothetical protein
MSFSTAVHAVAQVRSTLADWKNDDTASGRAARPPI